MSYFDRLEAELRGAVPHRRRARRWRPRLGGVAVVLSAAVALSVAVVFLVLAGHRHAPPHQPAVQHHRHVGPRGVEYQLGAVPTLQQLLANFAILRRPQTPQDRSWQPHCDCGGAARQVRALTRFVASLPGGYRVFLDVTQLLVGGQMGMAAGSYVLEFDVVDRHGNVGSAPFGPNVGFTVFPVSSGGPEASNSVWTSVVPDGVASVSWTFACSRGACAAPRVRTVTVPVVGNVAARQIGSRARCASCAEPILVIWRGHDGAIVASFTQGWNLPAPPFVVGSRGSRALRVLRPAALAGAPLGESAAKATQTLDHVLGPAAAANVHAGGCGIDHESVWTSPAVADPLTIFEAGGRFVGYRYGAPVSEIGLQRGPGAVLATARGLTLADKVGVAKRLYSTGFSASAAGRGTWSATGDGGTVRGEVLPTIYPLRVVTGSNPIATIHAGDTGCPGTGG